MKLSLAVGEEQTIPVEGYGFYYKEGDGPIEVKIHEQDGRVDQVSELLSGQGISGNVRFSSFTVINLHTEPLENIEFYLGQRNFVDNRMLADATGIISVVNSGGAERRSNTVTVSANTPTLLLPAEVRRLGAQLFFECDGRVDKDNTVSAVSGIPVTAGGTGQDNSTAELWIFSEQGGTVSTLEDLRA